MLCSIMVLRLLGPASRTSWPVNSFAVMGCPFTVATVPGSPATSFFPQPDIAMANATPTTARTTYVVLFIIDSSFSVAARPLFSRFRDKIRLSSYFAFACNSFRVCFRAPISLP